MATANPDGFLRPFRNSQKIQPRLNTHMKTTDPKSEASLAMALLTAMRGHARNRLALRILLGKLLAWHKVRLGYRAQNAKRGPKGQFVLPVKMSWKQWCLEGLGISSKTGDRYIASFEKVLEESEGVYPEIHHLLSVPSAELDGSELEKLAAKVEELVDLMTRSNLMIELGLTIEKSDETEKEECDYNDPSKFQEALALEATTLFSSVPRRIKNLKAAIHGVRDHSRYALLLRELDLDSSTPGAPTLAGIKEALEEMLEGDLAAVLKDVTDAYDAKLAVLNGEQPKKRRKNSKLANR